MGIEEVRRDSASIPSEFFMPSDVVEDAVSRGHPYKRSAFIMT